MTCTVLQCIVSSLHCLQDDLSQVFKAAVAGGINFFDTAEVAFQPEHPFSDVQSEANSIETACMRMPDIHIAWGTPALRCCQACVDALAGRSLFRAVRDTASPKLVA